MTETLWQTPDVQTLTDLVWADGELAAAARASRLSRRTRAAPSDLAMRQIQALLAHLEGSEFQALNRLYGLDGAPPDGAAQVGAALGLAPQQVAELEAAALRKLRCLRVPAAAAARN